MKRFSEYFADYAAEKNLTWKEAAKLCGVDRTLLSRYASGKKLPDSPEKVLKIAKGLGMSRQQTKELSFLYRISRTGEYQYRILELIERMFKGEFICTGNQSDFRDCKWAGRTGMTQYLKGREEIRSAIRRLVQEASYLQIHMNFSELLSEISFGCKTEQIIEMDPVWGQGTETEDFERMLPLLYEAQDYKIYCHYRHREETDGLEERISVMISDKGLILFAEAQERGICTYETGYREYYRQMFLEDLKKCRVFGGNGYASVENPDKLKEGIHMENTDTGVSFWYQQQPRECIWVQKCGSGKKGFYLEEAQLVKMFLIFMDMQQEEFTRERE